MRKNTILFFFVLVLAFSLLTSCSKFSKLQKSGTDDEKYKAALDYYQKGDFYRAGLLFEELIPLLKGSTESEMAQFYYAYTQYQQEQYNMSQFLFKKFYDTYARSDYAQEALYMHAYSLYKDSAPHTLDQTSTMTAISALQDFINAYPESPFRNECTGYIMELRKKLELKAYEKAKLYYKISDFNLASLKSAVISIDNFKKDFPDSQFSEELSYLKVDAQYTLAKSRFSTSRKSATSRQSSTIRNLWTSIPKAPTYEMLKSCTLIVRKSWNGLRHLKKKDRKYWIEESIRPTNLPRLLLHPSKINSDNTYNSD